MRALLWGDGWVAREAQRCMRCLLRSESGTLLLASEVTALDAGETPAHLDARADVAL